MDLSIFQTIIFDKSVLIKETKKSYKRISRKLKYFKLPKITIIKFVVILSFINIYLYLKLKKNITNFQS